jgi:hypothetical protein
MKINQLFSYFFICINVIIIDCNLAVANDIKDGCYQGKDYLSCEKTVDCFLHDKKYKCRVFAYFLNSFPNIISVYNLGSLSIQPIREPCIQIQPDGYSPWIQNQCEFTHVRYRLGSRDFIHHVYSPGGYGPLGVKIFQDWGFADEGKFRMLEDNKFCFFSHDTEDKYIESRFSKICLKNNPLEYTELSNWLLNYKPTKR